MEEKKLSPFLKKIKEALVNFDKISYNCLDTWNFVDYIKPLPKIKYKEGGGSPDDDKDENNIVEETIDFENFEFLELTKDKLVFEAGGDWQYPYTVTVKLVNGKLKITDYKPYKRTKELSSREVLKILGIDEEVKRIKKEHEIKNKENKNIMEINRQDLKKIIENILNHEKQIDETNFQISQDDPNMMQKIDKIKGDSTLYQKGKDSITIADKKGDSMSTLESVYTKKDVLSIIESKNKIKEFSFTKSELKDKIIEQIYNGKLYNKSQLIEMIKNSDGEFNN